MGCRADQENRPTDIRVEAPQLIGGSSHEEHLDLQISPCRESEALFVGKPSSDSQLLEESIILSLIDQQVRPEYLSS